MQIAEKWFPRIEPYCDKVNETRINTLKVWPKDIDEFIQFKYFEICDRYSA